MPTGRVVVIGNFDGVHRGHQRVLREAQERSVALGAELAVLTFDPHPAAVLGGRPPSTLTRLSRKVELLGQHGVRLVVAQHFDEEFSRIEPEAFVDRVLLGPLSPRAVVVGRDFRFGLRRAGDLSLLEARMRSRGIEVQGTDLLLDDAGPFSSTRVRKALAAGNLDEVHWILGRPHALEGMVVPGDQRGRTLGFPTANMGDVVEALPAHGVYAVVADAWDPAAGPARFRPLATGVANVGVRPTVAQAASTAPVTSIEVHFFDLAPADQDLYGRTLRIHLIARIREERRFSGLAALTAQIGEDARRARELTTPLCPVDGAWSFAGVGREPNHDVAAT